jgi:glycosidase
MLNHYFRFLIVFLVSSSSLTAQIVWTEPALPKANEPITVYFDATQGTGGLAGCNCDVYLHTGLITSLSASQSDWKHVFTTWGVANPDWQLTPVSGQPDVYSYEISPSILEKYNVTNMDEEILQMAFVFRNANGTLEGKDVGGADIFYDVAPDDGSISALIQLPSSPIVLTQIGEMIPFKGVASESADLRLYDEGTLIASTTGIQLEADISVASAGVHLISFVADNGIQQDTQRFSYLVAAPPTVAALPPGTELGINYLSDTEVRFALDAPDKEIVYLLGDFNNWELSDDYKLNRTPDGETWWIEVSGLTPGQYYGFQYLVDGLIRIGDPYSNLILDPGNDSWIPDETFPNMHPYPVSKTSGIVSLMQPGAPEYPWIVEDFERPDQKKIVIYELLMRDFLSTQNYQTLLDTLDYFERLGVNAIEFMPVNEFAGNNSWGYNPSYHYALDKAYGTPDAFKAVVDACHQRNISVILDVVFNHAHESNPLCMLYWDQANFRPAEDNPWLNPVAPHDYSVFFDFNHESERTRAYFKTVLRHWMEEYKIDGFRFDLSKGLTQNENGPYHASDYDASRIAILKEYADQIWDISPSAYAILEHFTVNSEEKELADYGMMIWASGGVHHQYKEAAMGYPADLNGVSYKPRTWLYPHLIGYMESHDEERMMYKNLEFGNSMGNYDVTDFGTALDRSELASAFFYTVPGPKMLWEFEEVGYDYSINYCVNGGVSPDCRLDPKPIRWDYIGQPDRSDLYNTVRALMHLRNNYEVFHTTNFQLYVSTFQKRIYLNSSDLNVAVLGNFDVQNGTVNAAFQHTGWWYEYFTGDSINISLVNQSYDFEPGEYRLYTDVRIERPAIYTDSEDVLSANSDWMVYPNPSDGPFAIQMELRQPSMVSVRIFDMYGRTIWIQPAERLQEGIQRLDFNQNLPAGVYQVQLMLGNEISAKKIVVE